MSAESIPFNAEVEVILRDAGLPVSDLRETRNFNLFGARFNGRLIGVVGVELYGGVGMLRSLAMAETNRSGGYGRSLVSDAEAWALQQGIKTLYLLTTTAARFFAGLGYETIQRSEAPAAIAGTPQFMSLCPSSSAFMRKVLPVSHAIQGTLPARRP